MLHPNPTPRRSRPTSRERTSRTRTVPFHGFRVLVVDDPQGEEVMTAMLTEGGCEVRAVHTAAAALELLRTFRPHLAVVELVLPGMSGLVLARTLKADPATRDIIIVALSAVDGSAVEQLAIESGCIAFVPKPIDRAAFARTLARQCELVSALNAS